ETAGIDHQIGAALPLGLAILAIPGQAGVLGDDGVTALGQPVEQGGLADVRAARQGDYGNHAALQCDISENTKAAASSGRIFNHPASAGNRARKAPWALSPPGGWS